MSYCLLKSPLISVRPHRLYDIKGDYIFAFMLAMTLFIWNIQLIIFFLNKGFMMNTHILTHI